MLPMPLQILFPEALGLVEESQLERLRKAPFYSVIADECTDIAIIEELSLFFLLGGKWRTCRAFF